MNKEEKAKLWADRIQQYKTSGQTCKQWCAENDIPLSTMGYWTRRLAKEDPASEPEQDLVFARLPSEQEAARKLLSEETAPVRIFVSDSIRNNIFLLSSGYFKYTSINGSGIPFERGSVLRILCKTNNLISCVFNSLPYERTSSILSIVTPSTFVFFNSHCLFLISLKILINSESGGMIDG